MRKIFIFVICYFSWVITNAQFTNSHNYGSASTLENAAGAVRGNVGLITVTFADTTAANLTPIKGYAAAMIMTTDGTVWARNSVHTGWIKVNSGSGSIGWQDVLTYNPDLTTNNYPDLNYKAFQMGHVGVYSITNPTHSASYESHIVMDSLSAEISNRDATLHLADSLAVLTTKIQFPHYATSDTDKVLGVDSSGNLQLRTKGSGSGNSWSLTGNAGTTASNFIGTTDAQDFRMVVNNDTIGKLGLDYGNISFGKTSFATNSGAVAIGAANNASGTYSLAMGLSSTASGNASVAIGRVATSSGFASTALSNGSAIGDYSLATGSSTSNGLLSVAMGASTSNGVHSFAMGTNAIANGNASVAMGYGTGAYSFCEFAVGGTNDSYTPISTTTWNDSDRVFVVGGNGHNLLTMLKSGNTGIGTTTPTAKLDVDGSIRFRTGAGAGKVLTSDADGYATWETGGSGNVLTGNILYVDAVYGVDSTGTPNYLSKPYKTITAAKNDAAAKDLIYVYPGTYSDYDLLKDSVNYHFTNGARIVANEVLNSAIFKDTIGSPIHSNITGFLNAYISSATGRVSGSTSPVILLLDSNSKVTIECDTLYQIDNAAGSDSRTVLQYNGNLTIKANMLSTGGTGGVEVVYAEGGTANLNIHEVKASGGTGLTFEAGTQIVNVDYMNVSDVGVYSGGASTGATTTVHINRSGANQTFYYNKGYITGDVVYSTGKLCSSAPDATMILTADNINETSGNSTPIVNNDGANLTVKIGKLNAHSPIFSNGLGSLDIECQTCFTDFDGQMFEISCNDGGDKTRAKGKYKSTGNHPALHITSPDFGSIVFDNCDIEVPGGENYVMTSTESVTIYTNATVVNKPFDSQYTVVGNYTNYDSLFTGNVIPKLDSSFNLGSPTHRFKSAYITGGSLYVGNVHITDSGYAASKVLTLNGSGKATWQTPSAGDTTNLRVRLSAGLGMTVTGTYPSLTVALDTANASVISRQRAAATYTLISDTSLFARKQMPAYSMRVNNTNAAANATTDNFRTVGETALAAADTVTWTGSGAPSGSTNNTYRWTQIGNRVWVDITLSNTANGSGITGVTVKLPTSLPTPAEPTGQTAASTYMYPVNAVFVSSTNAVLSAAARGGIRNNSNNNAYEVAVTVSSIAPCTALISFTYTTN